MLPLLSGECNRMRIALRKLRYPTVNFMLLRTLFLGLSTIEFLSFRFSYFFWDNIFKSPRLLRTIKASGCSQSNVELLRKYKREGLTRLRTLVDWSVSRNSLKVAVAINTGEP